MTGVATHPLIDPALVGEVISLGPGEATARLLTTTAMAADARGLVHGGFVFGLADYAAMLAVNHPNVVLGEATTRFLAPVEVGAELMAEAHRREHRGEKHLVEVVVRADGRDILSGSFTCFVLDRHVLEGR